MVLVKFMLLLQLPITMAVLSPDLNANSLFYNLLLGITYVCRTFWCHKLPVLAIAGSLAKTLLKANHIVHYFTAIYFSIISSR